MGLAIEVNGRKRTANKAKDELSLRIIRNSSITRDNGKTIRCMEMESWNIGTMIITKEKWRRINDMEKENWQPKFQRMLGSGRKIRCMIKESYSLKMVNFSMVNLKMESSRKVKLVNCFPTVTGIEESGKRKILMEKGQWHTKMDRNTVGNGKTDRNKDKERIYGPQVGVMRVFGILINSLKDISTRKQKKNITLVDGRDTDKAKEPWCSKMEKNLLEIGIRT
jgi:hypothetical protein